MTIINGLATQNSPVTNKSEYKPFVSIPKLGFKGKQNNLSPLSRDTFQASIPFKGINPDKIKELAKQSYSFRAMLNYDYGKLNSLYKELESVSDKYTMDFYNVPVADLRSMIASRIEELTPAEKIKNAVHISENKIGDAFVTTKLDNKPKQIIFTKKNDDYEVFTDDVKIGQVNLLPKRGSVYASDMESYKNDTYKGVGTKLHQLAVETSLANGFGGEVTLHAYEPGAKLFHYKSGFRVQGENAEKFSQQMEDVIAGKQLVSDIPSSLTTMYLPKEQIQKIIDTQIKPSPILGSEKITFKGLKNQEYLKFIQNSEHFKSLADANYSQLKYTIPTKLNDYDDKLLEHMYGVKRPVVIDFINTRLSQLEPIEKSNNAKDIKQYGIGKSYVIDRKTNSPVTVDFTKKGNIVRAYIDNLKVGSMNLLEKDKDNIYISSIISPENKIYKGVGSRLHQLAFEISKDKGYGGKVILDATDPGAKLFHYKNGFRKIGEDSQQFSQQMEDIITGKKQLSDIPNSLTLMYLPQNQIQNVMEKKVPILGTTKTTFKGGREQKLLKLLENSEQLQGIKHSDYKDLRWISESLNKQTEEHSQKIYGISLQDVKYLVNSRLQELLPSERIKNAKLLQSNIIGTTTVIDKTTNAPVDVNITRVGNVYDAFVGDKNIGETQLTYSGDSIFVSDMLSAENKTYKGLGTKLHQLAVEKSFNDGFGGNVTLHASEPGAKLFHYKSGFRKRGEGSDEFAQLMEDIISGKKPLSSVDKKAIFMFLPEQEIKKIIKTQIKKSPIILDKNFKFVLDCNPQKIKESQELAHPKVLSGKDLRDMMKTSEKLQSIKEGNSEYLKNILESLSTENDTAMINKFGININDLHYLINCRLNEIALKNK